MDAQSIPDAWDRHPQPRRGARWPLLAGPLLVAILLFFGWVGWASANRPPPMSEGAWTLRFIDEFDGNRLDVERWTTCYWWDEDGCTNEGTGELQWYRADNISLADGTLRLEAREEPIERDGQAYRFTSGMVTSGRYYDERSEPDRFSFTYGYVEVRARIPSGRGLWPAIWLLPADHVSTPEIDVMEALGHAPDTLEMHYHYLLRDAKRAVGHSIKTDDLSDAFHRYGVEWSPNEIKWYLDGKEVWRIGPGVPVSATPMYLLLNLAVGGEWAGPEIDLDRLPASFAIDYVKVWQEGTS